MEIKTTAVLKKITSSDKGSSMQLDGVTFTGKQYEIIKDILKSKDSVDVTITTIQDKLFDEDTEE